jgi:hypothetical protein
VTAVIMPVLGPASAGSFHGEFPDVAPRHEQAVDLASVISRRIDPRPFDRIGLGPRFAT